MRTRPPEPEPALDLSQDELRELVHVAEQIWLETIGDLSSRPVIPGIGRDEIAARMRVEFGESPCSTEELREFLKRLVSNSGLPGHPGFLAYIVGAGTAPGAVASLLVSALIPNAGGWQFSPAGHELERHLIQWYAGLLGLPDSAGGLVVGGGAIGNLVGLKLARDQQIGLRVRGDGLADTGRHLVYASDQAHDTVQRGADMLGLGSASVRVVASDKAGRMSVDMLDSMIAADLEAGSKPIAVVGTAGTTGTGAVDPLPDIASVADEHGLWFHVDAAYGGGLALVPELRDVLDGIERADSVIVDAHKWLYVAAPACLLIARDERHLAESFAVHPEYMFEDVGRTAQGVNAAFISPTFSRSLDALKVVLSLLAYGTDAYARRIRHDVELTRYLAARVDEEPDFELMLPPSLSICCFRFRPPETDGWHAPEEYLDLLNEEILLELQLEGRLFPSNATIGRRFALRSCIVNYRTEAADLDLLLQRTRAIGRKLYETHDWTSSDRQRRGSSPQQRRARI